MRKSRKLIQEINKLINKLQKSFITYLTSDKTLDKRSSYHLKVVKIFYFISLDQNVVDYKYCGKTQRCNIDISQEIIYSFTLWRSSFIALFFSSKRGETTLIVTRPEKIVNVKITARKIR